MTPALPWNEPGPAIQMSSRVSIFDGGRFMLNERMDLSLLVCPRKSWRAQRCPCVSVVGIDGAVWHQRAGAFGNGQELEAAIVRLGAAGFTGSKNRNSRQLGIGFHRAVEIALDHATGNEFVPE